MLTSHQSNEPGSPSKKNKSHTNTSKSTPTTNHHLFSPWTREAWFQRSPVQFTILITVRPRQSLSTNLPSYLNTSKRHIQIINRISSRRIRMRGLERVSGSTMLAHGLSRLFTGSSNFRGRVQVLVPVVSMPSDENFWTIWKNGQRRCTPMVRSS